MSEKHKAAAGIRREGQPSQASPRSASNGRSSQPSNASGAVRENARPKASSGKSGAAVKPPARKPSRGTAREAALDVLTRIDADRAYSNLLLNQTLQRYKLDKPDAGLATEIVYGTVQRLNTIDYFLTPFVAKGLAKLEPWVRSLLRLSFYQLYYLDRIPEHAIVNEAVNLAKRRGHSGISGMVNGVLRNVLRRKGELALPADLSPAARIALEESHPEWMVRRWMAQYGEAVTRDLCRANNEPPRVSLRVNRLRMEPQALIERLKKQGLDAQASALAPSGVVVRGGGNMALTPEFASGLFSVQDESSMLVAEWVDPQPGERVLDCCAAPGGKTTHLAEKMGDRGEIVACDVHEHKAQLIAEQAARLDLKSIRSQTADARELGRYYPPESFDRILLDAPCSGLGVIRRKPDLKWTKTEAEIASVCAVQRELLSSVAPLLKPGGVLVYSTCTVEKAENEEMVQCFLREHPEFSADAPPGGQAAMRQLMPYEYGSDGFFIARLCKRA